MRIASHALAHPPAALVGLHPDAAIFGLDLAVAVRAHAAAGTVAQLFGQFIGHDMPVELSTHWPHIWQSNRKPLTVRSTAATGARAR